MSFLDRYYDLTDDMDIYNIFAPVYSSSKNQLKLKHGTKSKLTQSDYTPWAFPPGRKSKK
jgi:hypothetical protein